MFKKTALGIASAAVITVASISATATSAQAGGVGFSFGFDTPHGSIVIDNGHGFHGYDGYHGNPCWRKKRRWLRTRKLRHWRRYQRCLDRWS